MCKIKTGTDIKTRGDVINLITALLLRQITEFSVESILKTATFYMKGSPIEITHDALEKMILKDIDVMQRNQEIQCVRGKYLASGIE